jgi:dihydrofolate reductase
MGKIVVSDNISLDGVIDDPTDENGTGRGNWFGWMSDADRPEWAAIETAEAEAAAALLMGRRSYEWFLRRGWPTRTGAWADRLRAIPKYVVTSSTLDGPEWSNSTALGGDPVKEAERLAHDIDGDIVVYGSVQLAHTLIEHDLVDEWRLMTYPVVVGTGRRLFHDTGAAQRLNLVDCRTVGEHLVLLTYRR